MGRKVTFKIGDRVLYKKDTDVAGCIVHKMNEDSHLHVTDKIWNVHWHNPNRELKKRGGRGIYSESELIKDSPNKQNKELAK